MAILTTQGSGNLASTTPNAPWSGGTPPSAGDQIVIANGHTVTVAADSVRLGNYFPARTMTNPTGASVAGGGSLPTASYQFTYTNVDSGGKESAAAPGSAAVAITNGNTLRITMPAKPTGVATRNVYIATGSTSYKLYATGTTGTTYDATSASWTDGTTTEAAAVAVPNGFAITIQNGGALTIKQKLNLAGAVEQGNGIVTIDGTNGDLAAGIEWDASGADSPANTPYGWFQGTANTQANCQIITANTDASHRFFIQSNAGGANGYFRTGRGVGFVGDFTRTTQWNVKFGSIPSLGDTTRDAITIYSSTADTFVQTFEDITFGAGSGALVCDASNPFGAGAGYSVLRCRFEQTAPRNIVTSVPTPFSMACVATTPTVTNAQRMAQYCYFLEKPAVRQQTAWDTNYYHKDYSSVSGTANVLQITNSLIRSTSATAVTALCDVEGDYFVKVPAFTLKTSGTATAGSNGTTSGTLTNSGASWGTTQYAYGTSQTAHAVRITGGTGAGQIRQIATHTATVLTVRPKWDTTPDATSTYEIVLDLFNPHYVSPGTTAGLTYRSTDCVYENGGCDFNGDGWYTFGAASNYYATGNLVLPNASGKDTSCCLITSFSNTPSGALIRTDHNTVCIGGQSAFQVDEGGSAQPAGSYEYCRSNIAWAPLSAASYTGGINGYLISNSDLPSSGTTDIIDPTHILKNWLYNGQDTGGVGGNGINILLSTASEAPLGTTDPQFVAPTRNLATWGAANGADGTLAGALALLAADPTLIPTMRDWVRAGFAPQNALLEDAGHDGVTIGAIEGVFTSTATSRLMLLGVG